LNILAISRTAAVGARPRLEAYYVQPPELLHKVAKQARIAENFAANVFAQGQVIWSGKMKSARWVVSFGLASTMMAADRPTSRSTAEAWAEAVAQFVTDPQFYRQVPRDQVEHRYLPLLRPGQIVFDGGSGPAATRKWESS
jgi:hypothetical protein